MKKYKQFLSVLPIILLLATCMTCSSLLYLRPKDCDIDCRMNREQKVGYPFIMAQELGFRGGSPLTPRFDIEDYIGGSRPVGCLLNILFYSIPLSVIWLIFKSYRYRQDRS